MDLRLQDKAVLVTGATKGIGAATARAFAAEGARVAILGRDTAAGTAIAGELPGSVFIQADLTRETDCQRAIAETVERLGRLDVLVNNAGVNDSVPLTAAPADFLGSLQRNLLHVFSLTHHARAHLIAAKGNVVNVTSKVAWTGQGGTSGYAAAKGAINALTREWAIALGKDGVRVNCVVPAECESDQYDRWFNSQPDPAAARAQVERLVPLGHRLTKAEELADSIVWLASDRASHVTGQFLFVDGGYTHLDRALTSSHQW
jgi:NAD(P)-dependent dehydrogenase (short-subunit alcohol dehydrogenase family)